MITEVEFRNYNENETITILTHYGRTSYPAGILRKVSIVNCQLIKCHQFDLHSSQFQGVYNLQMNKTAGASLQK